MVKESSAANIFVATTSKSHYFFQCLIDAIAVKYTHAQENLTHFAEPTDNSYSNTSCFVPCAQQ